MTVKTPIFVEPQGPVPPNTHKTMNRLFTLLSAAALAGAALTSCSTDDDGYHYLSISSNSVVYADQTSDTVTVISSDSWDVSSEASWLKPEFEHFRLTSTSEANQLLPLEAEPNTTGTTVRGTYVKVKANGKTLNKSKVQVYWMRVVRPEAVYSGETHNAGAWTLSDNIAALKATFTLADSAATTRDSVQFYLYDSQATLTTDASWITLDQETFTREKGTPARRQTARFSLEPNTTGAPRKATLYLRSQNGVTTPIALTQGK